MIWRNHGTYWLEAEGKGLFLGLLGLTMVRKGVYTSYTSVAQGIGKSAVMDSFNNDLKAGPVGFSASGSVINAGLMFDSMSLWRAFLLILVAYSVMGCASTSLTPGKVYGNISYTSITPDITNHLNSNPAVSNPGSIPELYPVRTYSPGGLNATATAEYTQDNTLPAPLTFQAAHYEIYPNVDPAGSDLLLAINRLRFNDNATYRFGSIDPASPFATQCSGVTPVDTNPAGTQCDIDECPALLELRLQFTGATADLDAIEDQPIASIPCEVQVFSEDVPGSGDYAFQASSGAHMFTLPELRSGNALIDMLVRGVTTPVEIKVGCSVEIKPGETGFVVIPDTGRTPLEGNDSISSVGCGQTVKPPAITIPVERHAGMLTGYFDVSGFDEARAQVCVDSFYSLFCTNPPLVPATSIPTVKWQFDGILSGLHAVMARVVVNDDIVLEFPQKNAANLPVEVVENVTTDIGATFVSQTVPLTGQLNLFDPGGNTDLAQFVAPVFTSYTTSTSYMEAEGDTGVAAVVDGASGIGGKAKGRLQGSYDTTQNLAQLNYNLLLNGISNTNGNLDGSEARPTPWDISSFTLRMVPTAGGSENIKIFPATDMHYTADLDQPPAGGALVVPEQNICFGRQQVEFHINSAIGSITYPYLYSIAPSSFYSPTTIGMSPIHAVSGYAMGIPTSTSASAQTASVSLTLPEGFQYRTWPRLYFTAAGGSSPTYIYLDHIFIPAEGVLGCGDDNIVCVDLQDEEGNYSQLSVNVTDSTGLQTPDFCITDSNLNLHVDVNSDGNDVTRVAYVLDPVSTDTCLNGPATELCATGCGPDPSFPINLTSVTPGEHTLVACANGSTGCEASSSYTFNVDTQTPSIQCTPDFTVTVTEAEIPVQATDPRIASNLNSQVLGNCGVPVSIIDDRPIEFSTGTTPVTFTASGIGNCSTNVTVQAVDRHISYIEHDPVIGEDVIRTRSFLDDTVNRIEYSHTQSYHFEYSDNGTHLAVIPNSSGAVRIIDRSTGVTTIFAVPSGYTLHDIVFDPQNITRYAIVGTETANTDQHTIFIYSGDIQLSRYDLPLFSTALRISRPKIAWLPDGSKITASFTQPAPAINSYTLWMSEWDVVSNSLTNPDAVTQNRSAREKPRELVYQDDDWRVLATDMTVSLGIKRPANEALRPVFAAKNVDVDLPPDGTSAAFVQHLDHTAGDAARPGFAIPVNPTTVPIASYGPTYYPITYKPGIAISSDGNYVALGLDDKILIFSTPNFTLVNEIAVDRPKNIEFKPFQ